jgi:radical SAM protein with 4Fe4S-binding SPASM domain
MERGLPLSLKTLLLTTNSHEIGAIRVFAEQELGLPFRFDATVNARLDCSVQPLSFRLDPGQIVELDLTDDRRATEWRELADRQVPGSGDALYGCGAGVNAFAINPRGWLSLCAFAGMEGYDLRSGTFLDGWEGPVLAERQRKITRLTTCVRCGMQGFCGMCPANGRLENGDAEEPVDFLCATAHLRYMALGMRIQSHGDCPYCPGGEKHGVLLEAAERIDRARRPRDS